MRKSFLFPTLFLLSFLLPAAALAESTSLTIRSKATIPDIFELTINKTGASELNFGDINASGTPSKVGPIAVAVTVLSNTGLPYQVVQFLNGSLENANGDKMAPESLEFMTASAKSTGSVISAPTQGSATPKTIYVSNEIGASDTVQAQYWLTPPPFQAPGDYSALLTYTASLL